MSPSLRQRRRGLAFHETRRSKSTASGGSGSVARSKGNGILGARKFRRNYSWLIGEIVLEGLFQHLLFQH
ncbi:unnamed protein product [Prunus armeniaca]|uniref:Uncharacterized protein n=1 Tax=Prunus armeniaca TaxID=36596 RepID=A0A6J5XYP7_PRUAR|nr:unnamed protein product [Prunus armeniaca]